MTNKWFYFNIFTFVKYPVRLLFREQLYCALPYQNSKYHAIMKIGYPTRNLAETDSTNIQAWRMLDKGEISEGAVVRTDHQTCGKGLGETSWESKAGQNLTFSVVLKPVFLEPSRQFLLTKCISLGVCEAVKSVTGLQRVYVKWPNDIYIENKKVAGILIETRIMGNRFEWAVAGIGINVNQEIFSPEIPNPVSLALATGQYHDLEKCFERVCRSIEKKYNLLENNNTSRLDEEYLHALYGFGQTMSFESKGKVFDATIEGVTPHGKLILAGSRGEPKEYDLKEVRFLY